MAQRHPTGAAAAGTRPPQRMDAGRKALGVVLLLLGGHVALQAGAVGAVARGAWWALLVALFSTGAFGSWLAVAGLRNPHAALEVLGKLQTAATLAYLVAKMTLPRVVELATTVEADWVPLPIVEARRATWWAATELWDTASFAVRAAAELTCRSRRASRQVAAADDGSNAASVAQAGNKRKLRKPPTAQAAAASLLRAQLPHSPCASVQAAVPPEREDTELKSPSAPLPVNQESATSPQACRGSV